MPVLVQVLRLCTAAVLATGLLIAVRGLPRAAVAKPEGGGACHAPVGLTLPSSTQWISQELARSMVGDPHVAFVDCRSPLDFEAGHVRGATHFGPALGEVSVKTRADLASATTVITYCDAAEQCDRSQHVAELLRAAGLPDVRVLEGGMPAWLKSGYPAESGTCQDCNAKH